MRSQLALVIWATIPAMLVSFSNAPVYFPWAFSHQELEEELR